MMQFNMYHHYTVDEHLIRTVGVLARDRARRGRRAPSALDGHLQDRQEPPCAVRCGLSARHRQGPRRGPFDRRRAHRARALPALGLTRRRDRHRRLADRAAPDHERDRADPRHRRRQDHSRLRRHRAEPGAAEAAADADRCRHPRRRARASGTAGRASCCARSTTRPSRWSPAATRSVASRDRMAAAQAAFRAAPADWPPKRSTASSSATIPTTG